MWGGIVLVIMAFVVASLSGYLGDKGLKVTGVCVSLFAGFLGFKAVSYSNLSGINMSKIAGEGDYYEVIVTTPVPNGEGTLVYAIDLEGNDKKADILNEYPLKGYKIEQVEKRTFLLPESARVVQGTQGEIVLISEKGKAINVPPSASGK